MLHYLAGQLIWFNDACLTRRLTARLNAAVPSWIVSAPVAAHECLPGALGLKSVSVPGLTCLTTNMRVFRRGGRLYLITCPNALARQAHAPVRLHHAAVW